MAVFPPTIKIRKSLQNFTPVIIRGKRVRYINVYLKKTIFHSTRSLFHHMHYEMEKPGGRKKQDVDGTHTSNLVPRLPQFS
jgi:hypothetical protein